MPVPVPPQLAFTKNEAAAAFRVSVRTISNWAKHRGLPHVRIGSRVLIPVDAARQWFDAQGTDGKSDQ